MDIRSTIGYMLARCDVFDSLYSGFMDQESALVGRFDCLSSELQHLELCSGIYKKAVDVVYMNSVREIQGIVNNAMSFIMPDYGKELRIVIDEVRNKTIEFELVPVGSGVDCEESEDVKSGCGRGVRTIISFIIHALYLERTCSYPLIMLDEGYGNLSSEYLSRFFEFVRMFCSERGLTLVILTHDPRLKTYADDRYLILDGHLQEDVIRTDVPAAPVSDGLRYRAAVV